MMEHKKKILIIMGGFFPGKNFGGPPVSTDNFCTLMKSDFDCYIVTRNHDKGETSPYKSIHEGWNDRGNSRVIYLSDKEYKTESFERAIIEVRPDYLYLQGLFQKCVIPCLALAKKHHLRVILAPRGELCSGAFKKKYKKLPYIGFLRTLGLITNVEFQSTSEEETAAIKKYLGVKEDKIHLLTNIPSMPHNTVVHKKKESKTGRFVFISRILWKKNLLKAINFLQEVNGQVIFDIFGPKEDETYWNECLAAISGLPSNIKVRYCGVLNHDDIHKTFCLYDAFLFPTLSENYGHVIAEALISGCIPIISDQTPWNDVNEANAGWAISLNNEAGFTNAIQEIVDMNEVEINKKRSMIESYLEGKLKIGELKNEYLGVFN